MNSNDILKQRPAEHQSLDRLAYPAKRQDCAIGAHRPTKKMHQDEFVQVICGGCLPRSVSSAPNLSSGLSTVSISKASSG